MRQAAADAAGHIPECRIVPAPDGFDVAAPATLAMIDSVCGAVRDYLAGAGLSPLAFDLCLGVREALSNAVRHGARLDPAHSVYLRLRREKDAIRVTVMDSGPGFDWRAALRKVAAATDEGGRGLAILTSYFKTCTFNEKGNEVTFVKEFGQDGNLSSGKDAMTSEITREGEAAVVRPGQDIVASMAGSFRQELLDTVNSGAGALAIDLAGVGMIDSMGLGVLIAAHNSLQKKGARLELRNVSADILKLLRNMRLDQHFKVC